MSKFATLLVVVELVVEVVYIVELVVMELIVVVVVLGRGCGGDRYVMVMDVVEVW